ncbi:MAG: ABC transporter ATP-binding protein [Cypionkella sp.]|jgi:branched-chain amino acid transport system ATP-binding protein|nr:ABC transporter ATP-binding protein [Cypionkella sp.]
MAAVIEAQGLTRHFGGLRAVDGVDFRLEQGEIHGLIGPNGAGKTTFVSLLSGRTTAQSGRILLNGEDITHLPAYTRVRRGIAYTFQITSVYPRLTVFDNIALAAQSRGAADLAPRVRAVLHRVGLDQDERTLAGALSYGHQRLLELGMGLALEPLVLILDEPTQGLAAGEIAGFSALIRSLVPKMTILLIEHNMDVVMELADRITVLAAGQVLAVGTSDEIRRNRAVQDAYLGVDHAVG